MSENRLGRPSQFWQLVESFPDAIVIAGPAGRIRYANAHAASLFGYERAHLRGTYVQGLVPDQPLLPRRGRGRQVRRSRLELVARRRDSSQFDLRPSRLEVGGLAAALRTYLERMAAEAGIRYQFRDKLGVTAPVNQSVLIYRAAQEALTNVREHAQAATVQVELLGVRDGCLVRIVDDGVGPDDASPSWPTVADHSLSREPSYGTLYRDNTALRVDLGAYRAQPGLLPVRKRCALSAIDG
jgi:PAS fold